MRIGITGRARRSAKTRPGRATAQKAIVAALSDRGVLYGTTDELATALGVPPADLFFAMLELLAIGWLSISTDGEIRHTLSWAKSPGEGGAAVGTPAA